PSRRRQHSLQCEPAAGHGSRHLLELLGGAQRRGARDRARPRRHHQRRTRHRTHEARSSPACQAAARARADAQDQVGLRSQWNFEPGKGAMSEPNFGPVDEYIAELLVEDDPALKAALAASEAAGLPQINVAPNQGKLLMLLAQAIGAHKILEIGTLGGYSTIWLARALPPGGNLVTLEANPSYAKVAYANIARAGLTSLVEIRVGPARDTLPSLAEKVPF